MKRHIKTYTIIPNKKEAFLQAADEYLVHAEKDNSVIECHIHSGTTPHSFTHFISFKDTAAEKANEQASYVKKFEENILPLCEKEIQHIELTKEGPATGVRSTLPKEEIDEQEAVSLYRNQEDIDNIV
ncbi:MAG: hypothetical protein KAS07_00970 [Candidatus Pacebacteria bacterium]|nr:hypothetical protein [Candidatus Paceibacterota bacterium]